MGVYTMSTTISTGYKTWSTDALHQLLDELEYDLDAGSTDVNVEADIELVKEEILARK